MTQRSFKELRRDREAILRAADYDERFKPAEGETLTFFQTLQRFLDPTISVQAIADEANISKSAMEERYYKFFRSFVGYAALRDRQIAGRLKTAEQQRLGLDAAAVEWMKPVVVDALQAGLTVQCAIRGACSPRGRQKPSAKYLIIGGATCWLRHLTGSHKGLAKTTIHREMLRQVDALVVNLESPGHERRILVLPQHEVFNAYFSRHPTHERVCMSVTVERRSPRPLAILDFSQYDNRWDLLTSLPPRLKAVA